MIRLANFASGHGEVVTPVLHHRHSGSQNKIRCAEYHITNNTPGQALNFVVLGLQRNPLGNHHLVQLLPKIYGYHKPSSGVVGVVVLPVKFFNV